MHPQKLILVMLSVIGMFATFLPWSVTPGIPAYDGTTGAGWITLAVYCIVIISVFSGNPRQRLSPFSLTCICIFALLNSIYGLILINDLRSGSMNVTTSQTSAGIGLYILIVIGFAIPFAGYLLRGRNSRPLKKEEIDIQITVKENENPPA